MSMIIDPYRFGGDTFLAPYHLDVVPFVGWGSTNGMTPAQTNVSTALGMGYVGSSGADADDGDWVEYSFHVAAGTYTVQIIRPSFASSGSYDWTIDGVSIGASDVAYGAGAFYNTVVQYTSVALTAGDHTLRCTVNGKHASSTDYRLLMQMVTFTRTGA